VKCSSFTFFPFFFVTRPDHPQDMDFDCGELPARPQLLFSGLAYPGTVGFTLPWEPCIFFHRVDYHFSGSCERGRLSTPLFFDRSLPGSPQLVFYAILRLVTYFVANQAFPCVSRLPVGLRLD